MVTVANPIDDVVFKYLMEDESHPVGATILALKGGRRIKNN